MRRRPGRDCTQGVGVGGRPVTMLEKTLPTDSPRKAGTTTNAMHATTIQISTAATRPMMPILIQVLLEPEADGTKLLMASSLRHPLFGHVFQPREPVVRVEIVIAR